MDKPIPPKPQCVENGGTREEWDEYHRQAAFYYDQMVLTIEEVRALWSRF